MNRESCRGVSAWPLVALTAAVFSLAGCGGGGAAAPAPADQSLSGVVIDGPLQGATVCLDLNKNGACDAGEPVSSATDAQGKYMITGLTLAQVNAGAPLIAVVPANAIDADDPTGTVGAAYTLRAPAGAHAVISPITTLVQSGIAQGVSTAAAVAAVAAQLQVAAASLYNDYTASTSGDNAALAIVVPLVVGSLQAGEMPVVTPAAAAAADYWVRHFDFTDVNNYYLRYFYTSNVPDANGAFTYYDERVQISKGSPDASATLYDDRLTATAQGWKAFDGASPSTSTGGTPSVATWGNGYVYAITRVEVDLSGQTLASAVAQAQDLGVNTDSTLVGVNASALSGTFPAGAKLRRSTLRNTTSPVAYRPLDGFIGFGVIDLAGLVAAYPVPTTPLPSNTASMYKLHGDAGCGQTVCLAEYLRVAFGANSAATYYLCDYDAQTSAQTNCGAIGTGTYQLETAADGSTPIMKFAGLPAATNVQAFTRVFVERNGHVYYGWQDKPQTTVQTRLNGVAFAALASALHITAPVISDAASAYAGHWSSTYSGLDTGSCSSFFIDATGHATGSCVSSLLGGTFAFSGTVTPTGTATFTTSGATSSGSTFSGSFTSTTGSGTWNSISLGGGGTWTATKQ
jgi:hypothetical protein